ncbi:TRAP transporter small permease [[Clostridium] scindens]|uniref:TRAP transporter small permease n=1 Tax=Clostridium scindens (strain JCM 10418 / VPI 12708) TaxID=29347 RepID=UPI001D08B054|nr:TRAP transporter small permease [[Clostridium] scindens]MCB6285505.1 TRAP transporter small permease [[Clostridium] scindens]MCB6420202.1 TRAP transporter small permease [[Clostridium] scindens]MCB7191702.1 TRAP transporter small permease [[Clostridium] scindens]MCB7284885.1 TRAP transporter small permease [[Clostridium] scindens]MCG4928927.1 TRAP transporter small permease [[Clostridium] scindens]
MKTVRWLDEHLEEYMVVILTSIMTILLFLQVLFRFVLNLPLAWVEEISLYSMVWLCYFGCSLAIKKREHLKMEIITNFLRPKAKKVFDLISLVLFFAFAVFVLYHVTLLTADILQRGQVTAVLEIPKWIPYVGVPVAFLLMLIRMIQDFVRTISEMKELGQEEA